MDWAEETAVDALRKKANKYEYGRPFFSEQVRNVAQALREAYTNGLTKALELSMEEHEEEPICYPLTNAAYDEAARTISNKINEEIGKVREASGSNDPYLSQEK